MQFSKSPTQTYKQHIKQTWCSLTEIEGFEKWHKKSEYIFVKYNIYFFSYFSCTNFPFYYIGAIKQNNTMPKTKSDNRTVEIKMGDKLNMQTYIIIS